VIFFFFGLALIKREENWIEKMNTYTPDVPACRVRGQINVSGVLHKRHAPLPAVEVAKEGRLNHRSVSKKGRAW